MAVIIYSRKALADFERLAEFLLHEDSLAAAQAVDLIAEAVEILENHPFIGREVEQGLRELVISHGQSGYLALYSYEPKQDTVLVLSVRHQREVGYISER